MGVNLVKGQKVDLSKKGAELSKVIVGLGWDISNFSGSEFDLDSSIFLINENGRVTKDDDFIFFNNLKHISGSVEHLGDNRTGAGDGDDEQIKIDLSKVPTNIDKIVFTVSIYDAEGRRQNFGQVKNAFVRVENHQVGEELIRYDLSEDFSIETSVILSEIYRYNGGWKFAALGQGVSGDIGTLCGLYGVNVG